MLKRLSDFYRIVNPDPPDSVINQRREAISGFLDQLEKPETQWACADIALFGLGSTTGGECEKVAQLLVNAIQEKQPAFSSDILANALDLRVCAGVALGEFLDPDPESETEEDTADLAVASLVISSLATRRWPEERYLGEFLTALMDSADRYIQRSARAHRERPEIRISAVQGTDVPTVLKSVNEKLGSLVYQVKRNFEADREELEILWWVFGGHSTSMGKPFQELDLCQRIIAAGSELAGLALLPPVRNSSQFLLPILKENRPIALQQLIQSSDARLLQFASQFGERVEVVLRAHPALLPMTWLFNRRLESKMAPGWEAEFEQKTHIAVGEERSPTNWARQVFNEGVAVRLISSIETSQEDGA